VATVKKKKRGKKASKERSTEWVVRWFDPAGDRRMKSFATKGEADTFATTVENEKLRNEYRDPRLGRTPLGEFYEGRWLPAARVRMAPSTLGLMQGHWHRYVEPQFADRRLNSVTQFDLRSFCAAMVEKASIYQAETSLRLLRSILRAAVEDGLLARSPADEVSAPRRPHHKNRYLTEDEVASLVAAHAERWRAFVLIAAYGGLRFGEIVGLRFEHVDFFRRKLRVEEAIVESGGQLHQRPTKSGKMRTVTLPRFVIDALANHMKRWPPGPNSLIFTDDDGKPIWRSGFYKRVWWPALKRAGVGSLRFHDLRHTSAALAIAAGAHPKTIQVRLGHHSAAFTLDVYGGLFDSLDEDLADKFDASASAIETPPTADPSGERIAPILDFRRHQTGAPPARDP
jgi:integrase